MALCLEAQRSRPPHNVTHLNPPGQFRHGGPAICGRQMETTMIQEKTQRVADLAEQLSEALMTAAICASDVWTRPCRCRPLWHRRLACGFARGMHSPDRFSDFLIRQNEAIWISYRHYEPRKNCFQAEIGFRPSLGVGAHPKARVRRRPSPKSGPDLTEVQARSTRRETATAVLAQGRSPRSSRCISYVDRRDVLGQDRRFP